jgi:hypothetical protein
LAALEYLRDSVGMGQICRLLKELPSSDLATVLQNDLRMNYSSFEEEVASYVVKKYGQ